ATGPAQVAADPPAGGMGWLYVRGGWHGGLLGAVIALTPSKISRETAALLCLAFAVAKHERVVTPDQSQRVPAAVAADDSSLAQLIQRTLGVRARGALASLSERARGVV